MYICGKRIIWTFFFKLLPGISVNKLDLNTTNNNIKFTNYNNSTLYNFLIYFISIGFTQY